jgi:hypothetical protein
LFQKSLCGLEGWRIEGTHLVIKGAQPEVETTDLTELEQKPHRGMTDIALKLGDLCFANATACGEFCLSPPFGLPGSLDLLAYFLCNVHVRSLRPVCK